MENEIEIGSVVYLKSAPDEKLTVTNWYSDYEFQVMYFNLRTNTFDTYIVHKKSLSLFKE